MATEIILTPFENFNDHKQCTVDVIAETEIHCREKDEANSWTEGYLFGYRNNDTAIAARNMAASLVTLVSAMNERTPAEVEAASLAVADFLLLAITSEDWPLRMPGRVKLVAEQLKPALGGTPEYILREEAGILHRFDSLSDLLFAVESGVSSDDVSIRWRRGEATISRSRFLADLRQAISPLQISRTTEDRT